MSKMKVACTSIFTGLSHNAYTLHDVQTMHNLYGIVLGLVKMVSVILNTLPYCISKITDIKSRWHKTYTHSQVLVRVPSWCSLKWISKYAVWTMAIVSMLMTIDDRHLWNAEAKFVPDLLQWHAPFILYIICIHKLHERNTVCTDLKFTWWKGILNFRFVLNDFIVP